MPLYVKDAEVDRLADRLAELRRSTKTEVVRQALRHELEREQTKPSLVEIGVEFARRLRLKAGPAATAPMSKADIDALYEDN
jgi:antitoxin VapB